MMTNRASRDEFRMLNTKMSTYSSHPSKRYVVEARFLTSLQSDEDQLYKIPTTT